MLGRVSQGLQGRCAKPRKKKEKTGKRIRSRVVVSRQKKGGGLKKRGGGKGKKSGGGKGEKGGKTSSNPIMLGLVCKKKILKKERGGGGGKPSNAIRGGRTGHSTTNY